MNPRSIQAVSIILMLCSKINDSIQHGIAQEIYCKFVGNSIIRNFSFKRLDSEFRKAILTEFLLENNPKGSNEGLNNIFRTLQVVECPRSSTESF